MSNPQPATTYRYPQFSRVLLVIGAICFFLAAIIICGAKIFDSPAWAWAFGGFAAWMLSGAV